MKAESSYDEDPKSILLAVVDRFTTVKIRRKKLTRTHEYKVRYKNGNRTREKWMSRGDLKEHFEKDVINRCIQEHVDSIPSFKDWKQGQASAGESCSSVFDL